MWIKWQKKISKLPRWVINPYLLVSLAFSVWMIFFDESNCITQYRKYKELSDLIEKQNFYKEQIAKTNEEYRELNTNPATQEKFAREHFWMKRDKEDVFVIITKK